MSKYTKDKAAVLSPLPTPSPVQKPALEALKVPVSQRRSPRE